MPIDLTTTSAAIAAWGPVEAQLTVEGNPPGSDGWKFARAQFENELEGLATQIAEAGPDQIPVVARSAASLVQGAWTVAGSVAHVSALIAGASSEPPAQLIASTTGILIGIMAAVAPATAGIGSAIVAGLGIALQMLGNAGLLGGAPKGKEICPGVYVDPPPDWVVGCVGFRSPAGNGQPIAGPVSSIGGGKTTPNPLWARFPRPGRDKAWFTPGYLAAGLPGQKPGRWTRKIDVAWPQWAWLEWDVAHPDARLGDLQRAYLTAWKANAERAMNGQKAAPDEAVLAHVLRVWNYAHASAGAGDVTLTQQDLPDWTRVSDPPAHGPYIASLIRSMQGQGLTDAFGLSGGAVVHMGPRLSSKVAPIAVHLGHLGAAGARPIPVRLGHLFPRAGIGGAKLAIGAAVAAALGAAAVAMRRR